MPFGDSCDCMWEDITCELYMMHTYKVISDDEISTIFPAAHVSYYYGRSLG